MFGVGATAHGFSPYGGQGPLILGILWTEMTLAAILISLRLYVAVHIRTAISWDFFWASATLMIGVIGTIMATVGVTHGMGNHLENLQPQDAEIAALFTLISISIFIFGYGPGKVAIAAFLLKLQGHTHPKKGLFLHFLAYSNLLINVVQTILNFVQCTPPKKSWKPETPGNCNNVLVDIRFGYLQGAWSAATDLILAAYPIIVFWNLQMPLRLKVGLCLLMGTGVFSCICACLKIYQIDRVNNVQDRTDALTPLVLWGWTEYWVVLIAGSLPPLRPLFVQAFRHISIRFLNKDETEPDPRRASFRYPQAIPMRPWLSRRGKDQHQRLKSGQNSQETFVPRNSVRITHDVSVLKEAATKEERRQTVLGNPGRTIGLAKDVDVKGKL